MSLLVFNYTILLTSIKQLSYNFISILVTVHITSFLKAPYFVR